MSNKIFGKFFRNLETPFKCRGFVYLSYMNVIITESQYKMINENISKYLRRRLHFDMMKDEMEYIIEYQLLPCEFSTPGEYVSEACDLLAQKYLEELTVSSKDSDGLYLFLVDLFGKQLVEIYNKECS